MINLAEKHDEEQTAHLADAEILRILSTLQKAEFKKSETGNALPDQTFKPRSLLEIAETARQQSEAEIDDTVDNVSPRSDDPPADDIGPGITVDDQLHEQPSSGELDNLPQESGLELPTAEPDAPDPENVVKTDAGLDADAGVDIGTDNELDKASPTSTFETAKMAYDRGFADGIVAGQEAAEAELRKNIEAEFEAKFADKIDTFESALTALVKPQISDINSLSASLQAAVVRLAASRTGMAIDELPQLLMTRIEKLAEAAGKNVSAGNVFMHPDDCAVIAPIMEERQCPVQIEADSQLYRGDIRIRFDGMDISDVADLRADWKISKPMSGQSASNAELSQTKISQTGQEIQTSDNLSVDLQSDSAQSNITPSSSTDVENGNPSVDGSYKSEDVFSSNPTTPMPLTTTGGEESGPDMRAEEQEETSTPNPTTLMPLTTTSGEESGLDQGAEEQAEATSPSSIDLMPLTTTGGEDSGPDQGAEQQAEASSPNSIDLMPLTTTSGEESLPDQGANEQEETPTSNPTTLMPLTSKNIDE